MSSKVESCKEDDEDINDGLLLHDIKEISNALYLHENPHNNHLPNIISKTGIPQPKSNIIIQDLLQKDKKSSIWNWKPFKSLTNTSNHRFNCCFFLHVHAIDGLPPNFNNLDLCVTWKRNALMLRTCPARVSFGVAEFEETLMHQCTIQCSRKNGPRSLVTYEPVVFLLCSSVIGAGKPEMDIGNQWIDLSRLLPLTLEELDGSSGKWTTSFKLTAGNAKGAILNVSFGFSILGGSSFEPGYLMKVPDIVREGQYCHSENEAVKFLEEMLYQKLDEGKIGIMKEFELYHEYLDDESDNVEFDVIEQGVEKCDSQRFESCVIETIDVAEIFQGVEADFDECFEWNSNLDTNNHDEHGDYEQENYLKSYKGKKLMKSLSLDDVAEEAIENDFLNMLGFNQSPPRDISRCSWENPNLDLSLGGKRNALMLENLETEALMQEWGLNEAAFQHSSPRANSGGFGSPIFLPAEEPLKLPSIEEGLGPIIPTKDGGFLRSMNPLLFRNVNNDARLIVQVSAPVVLPSKMGFKIMEILQCWSSEGVEKMCLQVNELMPLEDVTGKTMQQVFSEAESKSDDFKRWALKQDFETIQIQSDYVSIEDLVPLAISNIEGLLVEGLKIQSGMPDQEAPSSIRVQLPKLSRNFNSKRVLDDDELIHQSLQLQEWIKLDSQEFQNEHDGNILGKHFVMCLKLQLRDPFRNYEPVGLPMLALVQVERVYSDTIPEGIDEKFKVSAAHIAGLNVLHGKNKQFWGTNRQQQSGLRWLFSNQNVVISNSNAVTKSSSRLMRKGKASLDDVLWSISVPAKDEAAMWDEHVALNVHVRNSDIIFPIDKGKHNVHGYLF